MLINHLGAPHYHEGRVYTLTLFYDKNDLKHADKLGDKRPSWLQELGASALSEAALDEPGFLFSYDLGLEHLEKQVGSRPKN